MAKKGSTISNTCASIVGGCLLYFANEISHEQVKFALTSLIPGITLLIAYIFKVISSYGVLGLFKFLLKRKTDSQLERLKDAIADPNITEVKREKYKKDYEEALDISMGIENQDIQVLETFTNDARTKFRDDVSSSYQDNNELNQSLDSTTSDPTTNR